MTKRIHIFAEFVRTLCRYGLHVREVIIGQVLLILLGGLAIAKIENISLVDAIYFAFITGLSVGFGDIHPETTAGKVVSVCIGFVGMLFVGLTVAVATRALADTTSQRADESTARRT